MVTEFTSTLVEVLLIGKEDKGPSGILEMFMSYLDDSYTGVFTCKNSPSCSPNTFHFTQCNIPQWQIFFFFFCLFRAALVAHGDSQARGLIGAVLPTYARATAMPDQSHVCDLHHSSQQHWILNPLSKARDQTQDLMDTRWVHYHRATTGTPFWWVFWWPNPPCLIRHLCFFKWNSSSLPTAFIHQLVPLIHPHLFPIIYSYRFSTLSKGPASFLVHIAFFTWYHFCIYQIHLSSNITVLMEHAVIGLAHNNILRFF